MAKRNTDSLCPSPALRASSPLRGEGARCFLLPEGEKVGEARMRDKRKVVFLLSMLFLAARLNAATVKATVTDADGKPVADAVVFAPDANDKIIPSTEPYAMDQVNKEFVPHLLPILVGSKVRFPNKDDIHHEIYSFSPAKTFEQPLYKGEPAAPLLFDKPGVVKLGCNIHDWMSGIILVLPNAHFAKTGADGKAELDVPAGTELEVFHERLKGSVDDTKKKPEAGVASWTLTLKPEKKKKRTEIGYQ